MTPICIDSRFANMLYAYELGMLKGDELRDMELHLLACEACYGKVAAFASTAELLRRSTAVANAVNEQATDDAPGRAESTPVSRNNWRFFTRISLAAAAVLVLLLLKPWQFEFRPTLDAVAAEPRLVIMPFENLSNSNDTTRLGDIVTALLITDLSESHYLQVVSSQRVHDIVRLLKRSNDLETSDDLAASVAEKAKAVWLVTGSVIDSDNGPLITAHLIDVAGGVLLGSQEAGIKAGESLFELIDQLSAQLKQDMALPDLALAEIDRPVAEVTTHSTEAFKHYLDGLELSQQMYRAEARESFAAALEFDSTFAMAYYRLALLGDAASIARAVEFAPEASRREQFYIRAHQAAVDRNYDEQVAQLKSLLDGFPDEKDACFLIGQYYYRLLEPDSAIAYLSQAIEIDPLFRGAYNLLTYTYSHADDFPKAIWAINKYITMAPAEANPYDTRGDLYAEHGELDRAAESYAQALEVKPGFVASAGKLIQMRIYQGEYEAAELLLAQLEESGELETLVSARLYRIFIELQRGQITQALVSLNSLISVTNQEYSAVGRDGGKAILHRIKSRIHAELGDFEAARRDIDECIEIFRRLYPSDSVAFLHLTAEYLAADQKLAAAGEIYSRLKQYTVATDKGACYHYWTGGMIEMAKANPQDAVEYLEKAAEITTVGTDFYAFYMLARAYLEAGQLSQAVELFEHLQSVYSADRLSETIANVKLHYYTAIAYQESRWYGRAAEEYQTFLDLWSEANPELYLIVDARARLAQVKTNL